MKNLNYYSEIPVSFPNKDNYTTTYYYKRGILKAIKKQFDESFNPPKNCVEEKVIDEKSYDEHLSLYLQEKVKLEKEFRLDLISEFNLGNHPKANLLFDKSWEVSGGNFEDVVGYFSDLIELIK